MFLPTILTKLIVGSLPPELGQYVVEGNEDVHVGRPLGLLSPFVRAGLLHLCWLRLDAHVGWRSAPSSATQHTTVLMMPPPGLGCSMARQSPCAARGPIGSATRAPDCARQCTLQPAKGLSRLLFGLEHARSAHALLGQQPHPAPLHSRRCHALLLHPQLSGEFRLIGQSLATYVSDVLPQVGGLPHPAVPVPVTHARAPAFPHDCPSPTPAPLPPA